MLKVLVVVLLAACNQQHPQRQQKISDAELERWRTGMPGMKQECLEKLKWGGIEALPNELDKCFKMLPPTRWRGLWRRDFEASIFCPAPAKRCSNPYPDNAIQLEFRSGLKLAGIDADTPPGGLYALDLIGRRTAQGGMYGPLAQELIVDRMISIKQVEAPPKS
jgi:hypothetical protein